MVAVPAREEEPGGVVVAVPGREEEPAAAPRLQRRRRRTKYEMQQARAVAVPTKYGKPSERTKEQHELLCARMREKRNKKRREAMKQQFEDNARRVMSNIASSSCLREGHMIQLKRFAIASKKNKRLRVGQEMLQLSVDVATPGRGKKRRITNDTVVALAHCNLSACKDVAKTYKMSPKNVRISRKIVAWALLNRQTEACDQIAKHSTPTLKFMVSSMAFDETAEKLALDVTCFPEKLRLTWKLLVCLQDIVVGDCQYLCNFCRSASSHLR